MRKVACANAAPNSPPSRRGEGMPQTISPGSTVRILSVDGGGIRGILPARLLQEIERRTGKPAADLFHLIAGTSTGGIIGCGLVNGMPAAELGDLYAKQGAIIFQRSMWHRMINPAQLLGAKFDPAAIEKILLDVLGGVSLGNVANAELLVPTYVIELPRPEGQDGFDVVTTRTPMFFKTWKARGVALGPGEVEKEFDFKLRDVARATSAAPTYFPPAQIANAQDQKFAVIDGGVFANNPAMCALSSAYRLFSQAKRFVLVSLGTGSLERDIPYAQAKDWGELQWLHPILSVLMDGNADTVCYQCDQILGSDHYRFQISLGRNPNDPTAVNEDFDDASPDNVARLERLSRRLIAEADAKLDTLCAELVKN